MKGQLIIFVVGSFLSSSLGTDEANKCEGDTGSLKYEVGKSYSYNYGVHAYGDLEFDRQSHENKPVVHINGSVILSRVSGCEFILTLKKTVISSRLTNNEGHETETNKVDVEESSLKFGMNNGAVHDIYFSEDDPSWSVNLKKTIIFMIQNKDGDSEKDMELETSVFGNCITQYTKSDKSRVKITHLNQCGQGEGSNIAFQGVPYHIPLVTNKPMFGFLRHGHVRCSQTFDNGILTDVICSERNSGPTLVSVLKFSEKTSNSVQEADIAKLVATTPAFYNFTVSFSKLMQENAVEKMKQLLKSLKLDGSNKAEIFIDLKKVARRISDLEQFITSEFIAEDIHKKAFYDALVEVPNDEAVRVVSNAAIQGQLDSITLFNFYTNIAFSTAPGIKALQALETLVKALKIKKPESIAEHGGPNEEMVAFKTNLSLGQHLLLGASGLAHQYCKLVNPQCILTPEYQHLVNAITTHVKSEEEDIVLGALHSLGNLDALTPQAVEEIQNLLTQTTSPTWLEIQAMDAFRRDPCQPTLKESVRKIFKDVSKTDQVRIHAYLAASKCLTSEDKTAIQNVFSQGNSPVAGFIGSHIRNIRDSSSPSKSHLKDTFEQVQIPDDILVVYNRSRTSKFIEHSTFNEKKNLGFSGDATIIFIPGQAMPEWCSFNGTVDLYGRSFNFLEVGLSQRFVMKTMMMQGDEVPADWSSVYEATTAKDSYYRVLGTTIGLGLESLHDALQTSISKTMSGDLPGAIIDMIQPSSILDEDLVFPTISGLPLNFDVQAVSFDSIKVELLGISNFSSLLDSSKALEYFLNSKVTINTDSAVTLMGEIGLGANTPVHTGYKVEVKIDKQTNFGVAISSKEGPTLDVDLKFNFPNQIISKSDLAYNIFRFEDIEGNMIKNGGKAMVGEGLVSQPRECYDFSNVLGLRKCYSMRNGNNFPKLFSCSLEKENAEMQGFDIKITSDGAEFTPSYEITATTPGSKTSRLLKMTMKSDQGNEQSPEYWETREITVTAELNKKKFTGHAFWNRSEVVQFQPILSSDYFMTVDYSDTDAKTPKQIVKLVTKQPKADAINLEAKFDGPLALLGNFKYNYDREVSRNSEGHGYEHSKYTKHFEWTSDLFGKTLGDFKSECTNHGNSTTSIKVNHNNRIYEVQQTNLVTQVWGEEVEGGSGDYKHKYRPSLERLEKHSLIVNYHPNKRYEVDVGIGYKRISDDQNMNNLTVDVISPHHKPISGKVALVERRKDSSLEGDLTIQAGGEKQVDVSTKCNWTSGVYEIMGNVKNEGEFFGNLSTTEDGQHQHIHLDIKYNREQLEITFDADLDDDGNEMKQKTELVVDNKKRKTILKSESYTVTDRSKRTMDYLSKTTRDKDQLIAKVQMHAQVAQDFWNGRSEANMRLEDEHGKVYTASANQTLASKEDKYLKSNLAMDFHAPKQVPFTYNWNLTVDSNPMHADSQEMEWHITSDKRFTGEILAPFNILIEKDIHFHKKKGENEYELTGSSNLTDNGKLERTTDVGMTIRGNDEKWRSVTVLANGHTQTSNFRDKFSGQLDAQEMADKQYGSIQRLGFTVDRTDLKTKVTSNLIEGTVNKTSYFHDIMDFEITEDARFRIEEHKIITSKELIRLHANELIIFKEIEEIDGDKVHDTKFLIDISVKDENHQTKFVMRSKSNFHPAMHGEHVNFTLSK